MIDITNVTCSKLDINTTEIMTSVTKKIKLMKISISDLKQLIYNVLYQPIKYIVSLVFEVADTITMSGVIWCNRVLYVLNSLVITSNRW